MLCVLAAMAVCAVAQTVTSVITCPAEDASTAMRISWAADGVGTKVLLRRAGDDWSKAKTITPETEFRCATFDSVYSITADRQDVYEMPRIIKCGATLSGLKPATRYEYQIAAADGSPASEQYSFVTAGAKPWTCCIISDFHAYNPLMGRKEAAMSMIDKVKAYRQFDWVLHLGDVVAWGGSWSFWVTLYQHQHFCNYMWAGLNGNHDNMSRAYKKQTNDYFRQANYLPRNGYEGEEGVCYHFRYGEVMFVMLNSESMRTDEGLAAAQQWVEKVVTEARQSKNAPRYVVVCEHYQWFFGNDGKTSQYSRWSELFDRLGVDLALAGNNHIYVRTNALYGGKETDGSRGTVYVQTPSSDDERGQAMKDLTHNQDIIKRRWTEGAKTVGAMSMTVDSQRMILTLLDRTGATIDKVVVLAKQ